MACVVLIHAAQHAGVSRLEGLLRRISWLTPHAADLNLEIPSHVASKGCKRYEESTKKLQKSVNKQFKINRKIIKIDAPADVGGSWRRSWRRFGCPGGGGK